MEERHVTGIIIWGAGRALQPPHLSGWIGVCPRLPPLAPGPLGRPPAVPLGEWGQVRRPSWRCGRGSL